MSLDYQMATFIVDPFFPMLVVGLLLGALARLRWGRVTLSTRVRLTGVALVAFILGFFFFAEIPCYFDRTPVPPWIDPSMTCNEFMWKGYGIQFWFDPPIPSYKEWWSFPWLAVNFLIQAVVAVVAYTLTVRARFFSEKNAAAWSKPVKTTKT